MAESDLMEKLVKFAQGFQRPSRLEKRHDNSQKVSARGRLDLTAAEANLLIDQTKNKIINACLLLGLNDQGNRPSHEGAAAYVDSVIVSSRTSNC